MYKNNLNLFLVQKYFKIVPAIIRITSTMSQISLNLYTKIFSELL